jgi:hypothetical protein
MLSCGAAASFFLTSPAVASYRDRLSPRLKQELVTGMLVNGQCAELTARLRWKDHARPVMFESDLSSDALALVYQIAAATESPTTADELDYRLDPIIDAANGLDPENADAVLTIVATTSSTAHYYESNYNSLVFDQVDALVSAAGGADACLDDLVRCGGDLLERQVRRDGLPSEYTFKNAQFALTGQLSARDSICLAQLISTGGWWEILEGGGIGTIIGLIGASDWRAGVAGFLAGAYGEMDKAQKHLTICVLFAS